MGLEIHLEPRIVDGARMGNGTLETRCRECSVTTTNDQHAEGEDSLCFTCGLFSLTERGDFSPKETTVAETLKAPYLTETSRVESVTGGFGVADMKQGTQINAAVSRWAKSGAAADGAEKATPNSLLREKPVEAVSPVLGLGSTEGPDSRLGVAEGLEGLSRGGIGQPVANLDVRQEESRVVQPSLGVESPKADPAVPKPLSFIQSEQPVPQETRKETQNGLCLHCKGKPVFNKKESLCKPCAHAKWRYGWDEFPPGWKPGDRLKSFEKKGGAGGCANPSPGKFSVSKAEQDRDRVLEHGWNCGGKRERTTVRSLRADRVSSWSRFGEDCYPWDKPVLGGGKGVLAALLAAEGSTHLLNRKLTDSLSRKGLNPKQAPAEVNCGTQRSGIEILQAAANQERTWEGGRTAKFSKGLPRLEMVDTEEEEPLERVKTVYPNEPASLVKVAVAAQVLLEIATSPHDPAHPDSNPEAPSSEQWKKPPPSRFIAPAEPTASSLGPDNDDLRSRMGENQSPHAPLKYGDQEPDELPLRSPDLEEIQLAGEAVTLQDLGVPATGGKPRPTQRCDFPPRIDTDGWTPRLGADSLTLGTATDGWTPNQDLEGFTPQPGSNGPMSHCEGGDLITARNKTPSFNDIAANVFKAGRAALAVRRGGVPRKVERPPSAEAKSKLPPGDEAAPLKSPRRRSIMPQEQEATPLEDDEEDSNELSPSGNRRKRKLKARQALERPGEGGSGEDGKPDSGASEQDAPIVSPGIHKRGRTRAVLGRNVSGNGTDGQPEESSGGLRAPGQTTGDLAEAEGRRQGRVTPGKGTPVEPPKKRKGSWGGARKRGEKVVLPDSEEDEAILPRIESASEGSREKRARPSESEELRKGGSGGGGILDLVKGRWDDAQRLRDRAAAKRAEAERMKRVAEAKHRLAQRMIERATELGNWPPGRKAKADERARRQQSAKKRIGDETETEEDFEAVVRSEGDSEEDEEISFDGEAYDMSAECWGEEGAGSEGDLEEDFGKAQSVDQACAVPDQERCVTNDGRGWRCTRPRLPSAHNCDRHAASNQPRSQHTKSETSSRRPEETATADSCPPFVDPLEPIKPKKHFGFRERTSFRPEHLQHLALRPPGLIPDSKQEGEAARGETLGEQPTPTREGFPNPEELLQLAKARQLKRARSARRHQTEAPGPGSPRGETSERSPAVPGDDHPGGAFTPGAVLGECKDWGGESDPEERRKRVKLLGDDTMAGCSNRANRGSAEGLRDGLHPNEALREYPRGEGLEPRAQPSMPLPGGFVQMVQSAAQTEPIIGAAARIGSARAEPGFGNFVSSEPYPSNPLSAYSVGRNPMPAKPRAVMPIGPWEIACGSDIGLLSDFSANPVSKTGPGPEALGVRPQNGLTLPADVTMAGLERGPSGTTVAFERLENGINGERNGLNGTYFSPLDTFVVTASAEPFDGESRNGASHPLVHTATPFLMAPPSAVGDLRVDPVDQLGVKELKVNGTNGVHRAVSKRDVYTGMGVTRSRAIEDGLPVGRTYTLPVELKLPVELRQPLEPQPFIQRGKRQTIKKKKRIPPPIDGIDDSMRCTKTGGSGWRCNQRRLEGYAKCERHMEIVAKRSRAEAKPVEIVPKEDVEKKEATVEGVK